MKTKKINVLHVVRVYGDQNQPYTTELFKNLYYKGNFNHVVLADFIAIKSKNITVLSSSFNKFRIFNFLYLLKCFINTELKFSLKSLSFKNKIKFFIKWRNLIKSDPKVIHLHHLQMFDLNVLRYIKNRNIPIICSLRGRDILVNTKNEMGLRDLNQKLENISQIHVISNYLKDELLKMRPNSLVDVVYRGVNEPIFANLLNDIKSESQSIKMIAIGRLVWEKGHIYLLDSVKRLKQNGIEVFLDIYGDGEFEEYLKFRIEQLGLKNNVFLKGFISSIELRKLYKNYNIAIQTSISEALSNGLLDVVVHNLPAVISKIGGMVEIVENEVNGIYCDINDPLSIDKAILKCIDLDSNKLIKYNNLVRDQFSIKNEINSLELLYKKIIY